MNKHKLEELRNVTEHKKNIIRNVKATIYQEPKQQKRNWSYQVVTIAITCAMLFFIVLLVTQNSNSTETTATTASDIRIDDFMYPEPTEILYNGGTFTIQDIVFDGTRLTISYLQKKQTEFFPLHLEVNGEAIIYSGNYSGEYVESGEYVGLIEIYPEEQLPDKFDLLVKIPQIGDTIGDWKFNTPITNVNSNSKKIAVGQKGEVEGIQYEVEKLELWDNGVSLHVLFHADSIQLNKLVLNVLDDHGKVLPVINHAGTGDGKSFVFEYLMEPIGDDVESLTISPFFSPNINDRKEVTATLHEEQLPLTISQGKMGDLIVTKIEEQNGQYTMYYKLTSAFIFGARLPQSYLAVEDELGNNLVVTDTKTIAYNQFKIIFSKPAQGDIKLTTLGLPMVEKDKKAQITVDLSKTK